METITTTPTHTPASNIKSSPPARILVVEDERKTRASLAEGLRLEGWQVTATATGEEAIQLLEQEIFDLLVIDWMLPGRDGIEVLDHARTRGHHTPVLMLTARGSVDDRVTALEGGVDDYLPKPFAFPELLARCRALLRRPLLTSSGRFLTCADLKLDTRARVALRGEKEIPLTPREVDILEYFLRYQGQIVTREMLERDIWKQPGRYTSLNNAIDVQMLRLRRKIDSDGTEPLIHTLRGQGYRLGQESA